MKSFKKFTSKSNSKFVWNTDDVEHHDETSKSSKFVWKPNDVEHHSKKDLDEKYVVPSDIKGGHDNPEYIEHKISDFKHPHRHGGEVEPGDEHYTKVHDSLPSHELRSVSFYKSNGYKILNRGLRQGKGKVSSTNKNEDIKDHIDNLDSVTSHKTPEAHTVYRGGHPGDETRYPLGHKFTDHGYTSTSFRHVTASGFTDPVFKTKSTNKPIIHVIHMPKGTKGHFLDVHGKYSSHENAGENEFLLHRGTKFKVIKHSEDHKYHYIHSKVIHQKTDEIPDKPKGNDIQKQRNSLKVNIPVSSRQSLLKARLASKFREKRK